jgi:predicted TIM-barrel fold metal-dependent hydrolase
MISSRDTPRRMIVDFHCHYGPEFFRYREYRMDLQTLISGMDARGISRAVLSSAGEYAAYENVEGNSNVAAAIRHFPNRFIGFTTINPWTRAKGLDELKRASRNLDFADWSYIPFCKALKRTIRLCFRLSKRRWQRT